MIMIDDWYMIVMIIIGDDGCDAYDSDDDGTDEDAHKIMIDKSTHDISNKLILLHNLTYLL